MLRTLNEEGRAEFHFTDSQCERVSIYTRFSRGFIKPIFETGRLTIRRLMLPLKTEILLAAVHLPSKLYWTGESQGFECTELARNIREVEDQVGHARTVLVGDFNLNPFEEGIYAAAGLNAVMTREVATRGTRTVQERPYPFFYNPMWGHFGDRTEGPPGTYYYDRAEHATLFWNMFDQLLLRPELLSLFQDSGLRILDKSGDVSLLSAKGLPHATVASDHLPILFALNL